MKDNAPDMIKFPPLQPGGIPLMLTPEQRMAYLKKCGLTRGWCLVAKGEMVIIDRNMRQLAASFNTLAETAYKLHATLTALSKAVTGLDAADIKEITDVLALELPARVDVDKVPQPSPPDAAPNQN